MARTAKQNSKEKLNSQHRLTTVVESVVVHMLI